MISYTTQACMSLAYKADLYPYLNVDSTGPSHETSHNFKQIDYQPISLFMLNQKMQFSMPTTYDCSLTWEHDKMCHHSSMCVLSLT